MKIKFSKNWLSSKQPRKQRKYRIHAPLHIKGNFLSVHLSPELRKKYNFRAFRIRVGDKVKIMRGQYKGQENKVSKVSIKDNRVYLEKKQLTKIDGNVSNIKFSPSNLMIIDINLNDKKRKLKLESKTKVKKD